MAKESVLLQVRMSPKLKQQLEQICEEDETSISDKVRQIITNLVRSRRNKNGKGIKDEE